MKISNIRPKNLFRKKTPSLSRSDPFTSSSDSSDSSDSTHHLPKLPHASPSPTTVPSHHNSTYSDYLTHAFRIIDKDGDGIVTRAELAGLLSRVGAEPISEDELRSMLGEMDKDGDGCIRLEEFEEAIGSALCEPACDDELREVFELFDADHDGKITAKELLRVFTSIGDGGCSLEDCKMMIKQVDKNEDGIVCFQDFVTMMMLQHHQHLT